MGILKDAPTERNKQRKTYREHEDRNCGPKFHKLMTGPPNTWRLMEIAIDKDQFWTDKDGVQRKFRRFGLFRWDPDKTPPVLITRTGKLDPSRNPEGWWMIVKRFDYRDTARFYAICYAAIHEQPVAFDYDNPPH